MDLELFSSLLRNLLHTKYPLPVEEGEGLDRFEEQFCYDPALQPLFTAENLVRLLSDVENGVLYELEDELGVCLLFFRFSGQIFLVGPFVRRGFNEEQVRSALIRNGMYASYISSVRLYHSAFPMVSYAHARDTVISCIHAFAGAVEYSVCRIDETLWKQRVSLREYNKTMDYNSINRRYDAENRFLRMVETGDVEHVLIAYGEMNLVGMTNRYVNAIYQNPSISISMVRALARKAAERGGASLVEIHEITQRAVQSLIAAAGETDWDACVSTMILELTEAVRRHRLSAGKYSAPIQKATEFIGLNYSQEISLSRLAELAAFSQAHLSRTFKKEVGVSISEFICQLRCEEAAKLLLETELPVQEIGAYVGYVDNTYFARVFKKHYGSTPSAYRAEHRR